MPEVLNRTWRKIGLAATAVIVLMIPLALLLHHSSRPLPAEQPTFVGGKACISCHQREYRLWKGSDHDLAMEVTTDSTVLGDFNNVEVRLRGKRHKFYKRDGKFYVYTEGPGGKMGEFQITHTFGVRPLQQYLVPFENGKYQCLPLAWDTKRKRWFHLFDYVYAGQNITPTNWLYWTNQAQNWNGMCAECHSTNLRKNYDLEKDAFHTTWTDIDVNCEACHGPGSEHLKWAQLPPTARPTDNNAGLVLKTSGLSAKQFVEACAPCHSRRTSLGVNEHRTSEYFQNHIPVLPLPPYYFIDGQILEEDYVFASFTQSKMYLHDVKCNDCHDSHSLQLKFQGNKLCTQCHLADQYDTYQHHFHKYKNEPGEAVVNKFGDKVEVGEGAQCVSCHMPGRYYMGVDYRRDHSFRIPRPDLTIELGVPNACTDCHADKSPQWAQQYVTKYYGSKKRAHFATVFARASRSEKGADLDLIRILDDELYPEIVRASALRYLSHYSSERATQRIKKALNDPEPIIRLEAVNAFRAANPRELLTALFPLLNDPMKAVRIQAANRLSALKKDLFTAAQLKLLQSVLAEYLTTLEYQADFPTGRYNLGNYYANQGDIARAEANYRKAIALDSLLIPAKANIAMLYYQTGRLKQAETLFKDLTENHPEYAEAPYYLGLLYAEEKRFREAARMLEIAATRMQNNARIYYNLGLIYQQLNEFSRAESTLLKGYRLADNNFDLLYALVDFYAKRGNRERALRFARELKQKFPGNPVGQRLVDVIQKNLPSN